MQLYQGNMDSLPQSGIREATSKRVLIVDDNPDSAEVLLEVMETFGHEVKAVTSAGEALAVAPNFRPDIAFIDIGMPGVDGYALVAFLRSMEELKECRFVAATGYHGEGAAARSRAAGFHQHLAKPLSIDALRRAVHEPTNNAPELPETGTAKVR
jgi:CheY-like chemotaxis protein